MDLIEINPDNIQKAKEYLASIGKMEEYTRKNIEASQWSSLILFANQQIQEQNRNQQNG